MTPVATLGVYAAALVVVFGAAAGVGNAVGPVGTAGSGTGTGSHAAADGGGHGGGQSSTDGRNDLAAADRGTADELAVGGLSVSQQGYTLRPVASTFPVGTPTFRFTVEAPDGRPLTDLARSSGEQLHLIVVRRDLTHFSHVHPERAADGTWSVPLRLPEPGPYKVIADFTPAGQDRDVTLGTDLTVPGDYRPAALGRDTAATRVDGYDVTLDGALVAGSSSRLTLSVAKDGRPVTDLQPYLGAYGHLVALREGDLAYLHVHPADELADPDTRPGPDTRFTADVPAAARYRLFLDFRHDGVVRTAALTATAVGSGAPASADEQRDEHDAADGHDDGPADEHDDGHDDGHDAKEQR